MSDTKTKIADALEDAANAYREAAQDEINAGSFGSVYNVYQFMRESIALENKSRRIRRQFATCNCQH